MEAKWTRHVYLSINTLKIDENRTVSTKFRLDGRKSGRDQDFRVFAKTT